MTSRFGLSRGKVAASDRAASLPRARANRLVVEELGDELLVYDLDTKNAHCLGPVAAGVWRACDGRSRPDAIARELGVEAGEVTRALAELSACELLAAPGDGDMSRRELGVKIAKGAVAVGALPLILSVAAPAAAQTTSQIAFCRALAPNGTNNCNVCNGITGSNTICCCCHDTHNPVLGNPSLKLCAPTPQFCCDTYQGSHCTEGNTNHQC